MEHAFKHQLDGWEEREDSREGKYGEAEKRVPKKLWWAGILNALAGSKTLGR